MESDTSHHPLEPIDPTSIDLTRPTLFIVAYTHLDDVWRWSYPQTIREFLKNTLDENFAAFEEHPDYLFNWSGAGRYAMMREYYPERYETLKQWVDAGRWFPCGSCWVENDALLPSTESIIRQVLMGREYFMREFGRESLEYMLPDCFGFPHSLPSVLHHCGLRGFSTQKLSWKSANGIPFNIGRWVGPDGNGVIAALNCGDYARPHDVVYCTDEGTRKRLEENRQHAGLPVDVYYVGGGDRNNADRGGCPQQVSLETLEQCRATEGPVTVIAGPSDLLVRAITDEQAANLPGWDSELLLIEHSTGVLTSQAYMKKLNRDCERLADAGERAAAAAHLLTGAAYPAGALNHAWGLTLRNQFHDTLPGTCIPKAYEYAWNDGMIALNQFDGILCDAVGALARSLDTNVPGVPLVIYNSLSIPRDDLVEARLPAELAGAETITATDAQGHALPTQLTTGWDGERRVLFQATLPPVGAAVYALREGDPPELHDGPLRVDLTSLENARYVVRLDENGDIAGIFDKSAAREVLESPAQLEFLGDFPATKPAWHIDWKDVREPARSVAADPIEMRVIEEGPLRVGIEVVRENEGSTITQRIRLSAGPDGNRVEVANRIDWKSRGALLKAAFPLAVASPEATYNLDLGTIRRGNAHEKQFEVPHHGWLDLTEDSGDYGVSLLTGAKYGSDKPDDHTVRLTLLHTPDTEECEDETVDSGRTREMRWQDWGRHEFGYAMVGHSGDWREGLIHWEAQRFEQRPAAFAVPRYSGGQGDCFSLLRFDTPQVHVQAVKMAEDGKAVILRVQEWTGRPCPGATLSLPLPIIAVEESDGVERCLGRSLTSRGGTVEVHLAPYELKTIRLAIDGADSRSDTQSVLLDYDANVFSSDGNREDLCAGRHGPTPGLDGKGGTFPAEMIGDEVEMGNVSFAIGPRTEGALNAVACRGQTIELPQGTSVVHLLAAADADTEVVFRAGGAALPRTVGGWSGYLGSWDNRVFSGTVAELSYSLRNDLKRIDPAFVRKQRVAWCASHRHLPAGNTFYEYGYLFAYRLEIPDDATCLTLPDSPFVRIVAMSAGDEGHAVSLQSPFEDLHRNQEFITRFGTSLRAGEIE